MTSAAIAIEPPIASGLARATSRTAWIVSPRFDVVFFIASALAVFGPLLASRYWHVDANYILAAVAVVSNGPHLSATWTRVYLDRNELTRRPVVYMVVPVFIVAAVVWALGRGELIHWRVLNSLILYWATYHFAAQCYGLLRLYQRRSGEDFRWQHRAEGALVYTFALSALLWRLHFGPRTLYGMEAVAPAVPVEALYVAGAALALLALAVVSDQVRRVAAGRGLEWPRMLFLVATVTAFGVPFALIKDGTAAFAAAACWHGFQYLGIVWHFNRTKFGGKPLPKGVKLVAWFSQPGRAPLYVMFLLALAGVGFLFIVALQQGLHWPQYRAAATVWMSMTFSHYWVDGLIWKMRHKQNSVLVAPAAAA